MSNGILEPQFPKGNTISMTVKQNISLTLEDFYIILIVNII